MRRHRITRIAGLVILGLALFVTGLACGRAIHPIELRIEGWHTPGTTYCTVDNRPVVITNAGLDAAARRRVLTHEMVHVRQLAGDCRARMRLYSSDEEVRVRWEVEAYCAQLRLFITENGVPLEQWTFYRDSIAEILQNPVHGVTDIDAMRRAVERGCRLP